MILRLNAGFEKEMRKLAKVRQDAWSHEDDLLLAETVLRHIREGSTQLNAFEEVGDKLNRTSAACGFRWNAEIRRKYESAIDLAKRQRKEKKRALQKNRHRMPVPTNVASQETEQSYHANNHDASQVDSELTFDDVIAFLSQVKIDYNQSNESKLTLDHTMKQNEMLQKKVTDLEKQLNQTTHQLETIQEDYQAFIQIMERARKMTVLEDQGTMPSPKFRMDKNGNLEQVADGSN